MSINPLTISEQLKHQRLSECLQWLTMSLNASATPWQEIPLSKPKVTQDLQMNRDVLSFYNTSLTPKHFKKNNLSTLIILRGYSMWIKMSKRPLPSTFRFRVRWNTQCFQLPIHTTIIIKNKPINECLRNKSGDFPIKFFIALNRSVNFGTDWL